eukprot:UN31924
MLEEAWVQKKPNDGGIFSRTNKKRWLVLTDTEFMYYEDQTKKKLKKQFKCKTLIKVEKGNKNTQFILGTEDTETDKHREWTFTCKTSEEADHWHNCFEESMEKNNPVIRRRDTYISKAIRGTKQRQFRGYSVWLELPSLEPFLKKVCNK